MNNGIKLSKWAKSVGLSYIGAYRLYKANKMPCKTMQFSTGTIIVFPTTAKNEEIKVAIYARVSSHDQKEDLQRQIERLRDFCMAKGMTIEKEISEIGSGLNGSRKKLLSLLADKTIDTIVVEHADRLARFGVDYIEAGLSCFGKKIIIVNKEEMKDDLTQDFVDVVTSMCAKIYGQRSAKNKAQKALKAITE